MKPSSRLVRILKRLLFKTIVNRRRPDRIDVKIAGLVLSVPAASDFAEEVFANAFERRERNLLHHLIDPATLVVDVGANIGLYSCLIGRRLKPEVGRVLAFEPTPAIFEILQHNVRRNELSETVRCTQAALASDTADRQMFTFGDEAGVYNSLAASLDVVGDVSTGTIQVACTTLDAALENSDSQQPLFIKIDVEGGEESVVRGGLAGIKRGPFDTLLVIEMHEHLANQADSSIQNTFRMLDEAGCVPFFVSKAGSLNPVRQRDLSYLQGCAAQCPDFFFARGEALQRIARLPKPLLQS